jgi:hypothetical protein
MKTGPDVLDTVENEYGSAKHNNENRRPPYRRKQARERKIRKWDTSHPVLPKTNPGVQIMKKGPATPDAAEKEPGSTKHENGTRRPQYRQKRVPSPSIRPKMISEA